MWKSVALGFFLILESGSPGVANCAVATSGFDRSTDMKEIAWMRKGQDAVRMVLRDPDSASFRNVFFCRGAMDVPLTCGEVNSKNGFGGYVGFQRFISAGSQELTYLEQQVSDFETVWAKLCTR